MSMGISMTTLLKKSDVHVGSYKLKKELDSRGNIPQVKSSSDEVRAMKRMLSEYKYDGKRNAQNGAFSAQTVNSSWNYSDKLREQRQKAKETALSIKKLKYNFKNISSKILQSKTPDAARQAASEARREVLKLKQKRGMKDVDQEELAAAIDHAKSMERIAKKKARHLEEEALAEARAKLKSDSMGGSVVDTDGIIKKGEEDSSKEENSDREESDAIVENYALKYQMDEEKLFDDVDDDLILTQMPEYSGIDDKLIGELLEDIDELTKELTDDMQDMLEELGFEELSDALEAVSGDMSPEDIKAMKIKHRNKEMKDIVKADADYLKVVFDRLEKSAASAANASFGGAASNPDTTSVSVDISVPDIGTGDMMPMIDIAL